MSLASHFLPRTKSNDSVMASTPREVELVLRGDGVSSSSAIAKEAHTRTTLCYCVPGRPLLSAAAWQGKRIDKCCDLWLSKVRAAYSLRLCRLPHQRMQGRRAVLRNAPSAFSSGEQIRLPPRASGAAELHMSCDNMKPSVLAPFDLSKESSSFVDPLLRGVALQTPYLGRVRGSGKPSLIV